MAATVPYEVLKQDGPFELRRYEGYLTASVHVSASTYGQAANAGFNPLADYIFGNNHASDRIAMTAPVSAGRVCCQKIAMTAPVTATQSESDYLVSFTMPAGYSMEDLPRPNNPDVILEEVAPHLMAAIRFGGYFSERNAARAQKELEGWIAREGTAPIGEPVSAQYDAPWKPGFARRNEIMIPVEDASQNPR
jgi:hypothetical protein